MEAELGALRLLFAKEHSFGSQRRYIKPSHDHLVPLLIVFSNYFISRGIRIQELQKDMRLRMVSFICESPVSTFYQLTSWQVSTILNYLQQLDEEENGKSGRFLDYIETQSQV